MARTRDRIGQRLRESSSIRKYAPNWMEELLIDYVFKSEDIDNIAEDVDALREQIARLEQRISDLGG